MFLIIDFVLRCTDQLVAPYRCLVVWGDRGERVEQRARD